MQHAGGMLLPPVQKLVATIIFPTAKCKSNPPCPTQIPKQKSVQAFWEVTGNSE
jgi:hypothetical protein